MKHFSLLKWKRTTKVLCRCSILDKQTLDSFSLADLYRRLNALKKRNPKLKTLLGVGGWNMMSHAFSTMVHDYEKRRRFIFDTIKYSIEIERRSLKNDCHTLVFCTNTNSMDSKPTGSIRAYGVDELTINTIWPHSSRWETPMRRSQRKIIGLYNRNSKKQQRYNRWLPVNQGYYWQPLLLPIRMLFPMVTRSRKSPSMPWRSSVSLISSLSLLSESWISSMWWHSECVTRIELLVTVKKRFQWFPRCLAEPYRVECSIISTFRWIRFGYHVESGTERERETHRWIFIGIARISVWISGWRMVHQHISSFLVFRYSPGPFNSLTPRSTIFIHQRSAMARKVHSHVVLVFSRISRWEDSPFGPIWSFRRRCVSCKEILDGNDVPYPMGPNRSTCSKIVIGSRTIRSRISRNERRTSWRIVSEECLFGHVSIWSSSNDERVSLSLLVDMDDFNGAFCQNGTYPFIRNSLSLLPSNMPSYI